MQFIATYAQPSSAMSSKNSPIFRMSEVARTKPLKQVPT
jgi:hypothetical protein